MKKDWITKEEFLNKVKNHFDNINNKKYTKYLLKNGEPLDKWLILYFL